nr:MAG TPA: hypothetical protein [Caudoviricetes sp.]
MITFFIIVLKRVQVNTFWKIFLNNFYRIISIIRKESDDFL